MVCAGTGHHWPYYVWIVPTAHVVQVGIDDIFVYEYNMQTQRSPYQPPDDGDRRSLWNIACQLCIDTADCLRWFIVKFGQESKKSQLLTAGDYIVMGLDHVMMCFSGYVVVVVDGVGIARVPERNLKCYVHYSHISCV